MYKFCCGFGHREYFEDLEECLKREIYFAIRLGCTTFYTGGMGTFDRAFAAAVRSWKKQFPHIRLILVIPYLTKELQRNKQEYERLYDAIVKPAVLDSVHPKYAISKRNRWMVQKSTVVIAYNRVAFGGAYEAIQYAKSQGKAVIQIPAFSIVGQLLDKIPLEISARSEILFKIMSRIDEKDAHALERHSRQKKFAKDTMGGELMFADEHFLTLFMQAMKELEEEKARKLQKS